MKPRAILAGITLLIAPTTSFAVSEPPITTPDLSVKIVPAVVAAACKAKGKQTQILFDLCRNQVELLREAQQLAKASNKSVIVSFGADWCIWCHVFEAYLLGGHGVFTHYTPDGPWEMQETPKPDNIALASELKAFVAKNFVIVNIAEESDESGASVLKITGADVHFTQSLPFIYALRDDGSFGGVLKSTESEVRRDGDDPYRGYDRVKLLAALKMLIAPKNPE
jgi:Protein of unknown function, DUF255